MKRSAIRSAGLRVALVVLLAFSTTVSISKRVEAEEVRQAIEQTIARWAEAFNRGDAAAVAALYTDNATLMPPNSEKIQGRQGVQDFWHGAIQNGLKDARLKVVDVQVCGDTAYEIGKFSLTATSKDQDPKVLLGKYVVVWQRQADRTWKLHVDIWNSVPSQ